MKNQATHSMFESKYKVSYQIMKKIVGKAFDVQDPTGKIKKCLQNMCNLCILQNITSLHFYRRESLEGLLSILTILTYCQAYTKMWEKLVESKEIIQVHRMIRLD